MAMPKVYRDAIKMTMVAVSVAGTSAQAGTVERPGFETMDLAPLQGFGLDAQRVHSGETILGIYDAIGTTAEESYLYRGVEHAVEAAKSSALMIYAGPRLGVKSRELSRNATSQQLSKGIEINVADVDMLAQDYLVGAEPDMSASFETARAEFTRRGMPVNQANLFVNVITAQLVSDKDPFIHIDVKASFESHGLYHMIPAVETATQAIQSGLDAITPQEGALNFRRSAESGLDM